MENTYIFVIFDLMPIVDRTPESLVLAIAYNKFWKRDNVKAIGLILVSVGKSLVGLVLTKLSISGINDLFEKSVKCIFLIQWTIMLRRDKIAKNYVWTCKLN